MPAVLLAIGAYLLGAIPFGVLIGRARGVDILAAGSKNIGATNVGRVIGRKWGLFCLLLDILKGLIPSLAAFFVLVREPVQAAVLLQWLAVGVAAVLGHNFSIFLGFRGGKGVATTIGVALGIYPYFTVAMAAAIVAYAIVRFSTGWVSLGSLTIATVFPIAFYAYVLISERASLAECWPLQIAAVLLGLLIILRHRANIARLLRGEESRVTRQGS